MRIKISKKDLYTIPNILCYFRLLLVPTFMILYLMAGDDNHVMKYVAAGIILLAGFTDFLDGFIARKYNQITELGKIIDPLGDKLMQFAIAVVLVIRYKYMWVLLSVFLVKELFMFISDIVLLTKGEKLNGAKWFGKLSTFVFYIVMAILVIIDVASIDNVETGVLVLMSIATFFLLLSFILYIPVFAKMFKKAFGKKEIEGENNDEEKPQE